MGICFCQILFHCWCAV